MDIYTFEIYKNVDSEKIGLIINGDYYDSFDTLEEACVALENIRELGYYS